MKRSISHAVFMVPGCIALFMAFLMSCGNEINKSKFILNLLDQKVNLQLKDSIIGLTTEDTGIDFHGSWSETYMVTITTNDIFHILNQIQIDTNHKWIEADNGDCVIRIYPYNHKDTIFTIGIMKSKSIISVNMKQGF